MKSKKKEDEEFARMRELLNPFGDMLSRVQTLIGYFAGLRSMLQHISAELFADRICGSWISRQGCRRVVIRKQAGYYTATVYDDSRCYQVIVDELRIEFFRYRLEFRDRDGKERFRVAYHAGTDSLSLGFYGIFDPEEKVLREQGIDNEGSYVPGDGF